MAINHTTKFIIFGFIFFMIVIVALVIYGLSREDKETDEDKKLRLGLENIFDYHAYTIINAKKLVRSTAALLQEAEELLVLDIEGTPVVEEFKIAFTKASKMDTKSLETFTPELQRTFYKAALQNHKYYEKYTNMKSNEKHTQAFNELKKNKPNIEPFKTQKTYDGIYPENPSSPAPSRTAYEEALNVHNLSKTALAVAENKVYEYLRIIKNDFPKYTKFAINIEEKMDTSKMLGDCSQDGCGGCCAFKPLGSCHALDCGACDCCGCSDPYCCPPSNPPGCGFDGKMECSIVKTILAGLSAACSLAGGGTAGATAAIGALTALCVAGELIPGSEAFVTAVCAALATAMYNYPVNMLCAAVADGSIMQAIWGAQGVGCTCDQ